jgi:hypothetical protein
MLAQLLGATNEDREANRLDDRAVLLGSVAMVRLAAQDLERAVELLDGEDPDEPVRDRELAERDQLL